MDWEIVGAIGEIVGALAVVLSLVYVGRQVKLSNTIAEADAFRAVSLSTSDLLRDWAADPDFLEVLRGGVFDGQLSLADLDEPARTKVVIQFAAAIRLFETIHRQVEAGIMDRSAYDMLGGRTFRTQLFRDVWQEMQGAYSRDFSNVMESHFALRAPLEKPTTDAP